MDNLVSLDIETCCAVAGCPGFGLAGTKCDHALSPWKGRITKIAVVHDRDSFVCNNSKVLEEHLDEQVVGEPQFVGQNFKFDLLWLQVHGSKYTCANWAHDTQLMASVLTEKIPDTWLATYNLKREGTHHRKGTKHSLKTLAPYFLGVEPFWEPIDKDDEEYVLLDAKYTFRLSEVLTEKLKERNEYEFYETRMMPWARMLLQAELRGIEIDLEALTQKELELTQKRDELKLKLDEQWKPAHLQYAADLRRECYTKYVNMALKTGKNLDSSPRYLKLYEAARDKIEIKVDYDSPKQMAWLLRDYLGYNITNLDGDETTGREVLERLANEKHDDVATFLEWRKCNKMLTSFIPTYKDLQVNGRLHPVYNLTSTRTGRTSSERPNSQQAPPEIKKLIRAGNGRKFVGFDLKAIEALLIALYTNDQNLFNLMTKGLSIHDFSAKQFLELPCEVHEVSEKFPNERSATKNTIFALFFNAGANRIRATFAQKGIHLTESQCREIHKRFKRTYPEAYEFGQELVKYFESGEKMTNLLGRPLRIENVEDCFMKSLNLVVQSSASDLLLEWAKRSTEKFKEKNIDGVFCLFVHDFMAADVKSEHAEEARQIMLDELQGFTLENQLGRLPLTAEGGISDVWKS